jgi:hypothetical protein
MNTLTPDVIVGWPSGLTAAAAPAPHVGHVLVLDRELEAGRIPRHSDHPGYGVRDLRRMLSGLAYAARLVDDAAEAGGLDPDAGHCGPLSARIGFFGGLARESAGTPDGRVSSWTASNRPAASGRLRTVVFIPYSALRDVDRSGGDVSVIVG